MEFQGFLETEEEAAIEFVKEERRKREQ